METLELILLLTAAVLASSVAERLLPRVSLPLVQIGLGFLVAIFATSPIDVTLDPHFFLLLFIAPLLFVDAKNADKLELWRNKKMILSLAIGLVLILVLVVGFSLNWLIPSIPLTAAFALGAALGPTDAVAVSALSKSASLSRREKAVLSGEALLNDASGVVSFQFAIAACVTGAFSLMDASVSFIIGFFGGIVAGILIALLAHFVQTRVRDLGLESTTFFVLFDVTLPFFIYMMAEVIGVSGILAVVAGGLVISSFSERKIGPTTARLNIVTSSVWRVISFTLNGIVFVLLGMQLPRALQSTWDEVTINNFVLIGYVLFITLVLVVVRFCWVALIDRISRDPSTGKRPRFTRESLRSSLIATIGGPKGAVTLSIIFSLPLFLDDGTVFPQRNLIIFLASGVILCTLLLANFLLPILAPSEEETEQDVEEANAKARVEVMRRVIERLNDMKNGRNDNAVNAVIKQYNDRIGRIQESADLESEPTHKLRIQILRAMQDFVIDQSEKNIVDDYHAYLYIKRLGDKQNYLLHRSSSRWIIKQAIGHIRQVKNVIKHIIIHATPGITETHEDETWRQIQTQAEQFAIDKLEAMMQQPDCEYQPEVIAEVLLLHRTTLRSLERTRPDITQYTRTTDNMESVERQAYTWEQEYIEEYYDEGRLSRSEAKEMRDNILLMQLDLENHI